MVSDALVMKSFSHLKGHDQSTVPPTWPVSSMCLGRPLDASELDYASVLTLAGEKIQVPASQGVVGTQ